MDLVFHHYGLDIFEKSNLPYEYAAKYAEYKVNSFHLAELIRCTEARATLVTTLKQSLNSREDNKPSLIETVYIEQQGCSLQCRVALYQKARNRFTKISQSGEYHTLTYEEGETSYFDYGWDEMVDTQAIMIYGVPKTEACALTEKEKGLVENIQQIDRSLEAICSNITKIND